MTVAQAKAAIEEMEADPEHGKILGSKSHAQHKLVTAKVMQLYNLAYPKGS